MNNGTAKQRGFTLIELMIAVAVVGVLSAIAYPSYQSAVRKSHRNDGTSTLMDVAQKLAVFRASNASYTDNLALLGILDDTSPEGYYGNLTITQGVCGNLISCYTISIQPTDLRNQNEDTVTEFRLHSTGLKQRNEFGWIDSWK